MGAPCLTEDPWLTERLGKKAYHVYGDLAAAEGLRERLAADLFADAKVAVDDEPGRGVLQKLGFTLMDTNLRFALARRDLLLTAADPRIAFVAGDMIDDVGAIAGRSFIHDRFHRDPRIPSAAADAIKRDWARNFFAGRRGEWMVVARHEKSVAGFLQLLRSGADEMIIDLIAVDSAYRGLGYAGRMIAFAAANCNCAGPIVVGTQLANIVSVRLYEKLGFRLAGAQYVFHHHGRLLC